MSFVYTHNLNGGALTSLTVGVIIRLNLFIIFVAYTVLLYGGFK